MKTVTVTAFAQSALFLVWVGLLSIGASGALAGVMSAAWGPAFVAGDLPWETYTPDRCAELQRLAPTGTTCAESAALHHADETVGYRVDAGVLGLLALGGWYAWRRRNHPPEGALPPGLVSGTGFALFGVVGLGLFGVGFERLVFGASAGPGAMLSAGLVSLIVAAIFGWRFYRDLRAWDSGSAAS
jgi:hypothetical protein